jgi:hypothetical protein
MFAHHRRKTGPNNGTSSLYGSEGVEHIGQAAYLR